MKVTAKYYTFPDTNNAPTKAPGWDSVFYTYDRVIRSENKVITLVKDELVTINRSYKPNPEAVEVTKDVYDAYDVSSETAAATAFRQNRDTRLQKLLDASSDDVPESNATQVVSALQGIYHPSF